MDELSLHLKKKYTNEKTIRDYLRDIQEFELFVKNKGVKLESVSEKNIKEYTDLLISKGYGSSSISKRYSALRVYFKYLRMNKKMIWNPMENIKQPKLIKKRQKNINKIKEKIYEKGTDREKLVFRLSYVEKISVKEISKLKKDQYDKNLNILYIRRKAVTPSLETMILLKKQIEETEENIIETEKGGVISPSGIYYLLNKYSDNSLQD